jgi:RNA polymerase sigma-70 factor (ECF subfamily)
MTVPVAPFDPTRLTERIRAGEAAAEEELVARFRERVFVLALFQTRDRETSHDLTQDTLLRVLRAVREGHLREPERLAGFVCGIARNLVREHVRANQAHGGLPAPEPPPVPDAEERLEEAERSFLVHRVLRGLAMPDRLVLRLSLVDELSPAQIAERMGVTPDAVRQRKTRALRRARALLARLSQPSPNGHFSGRGLR